MLLNTLDEEELDQPGYEVRETLREQAQELAMEQGLYDGPIPADIPAPPGLLPKRAELARFLQWLRRTKGELEHLKEAHHRAIETLGGETVTRKKIDAILKDDVGAVLKFVLGGDVITEAKLRSFERQQLEKSSPMTDTSHKLYRRRFGISSVRSPQRLSGSSSWKRELKSS
jgi:hypothetical protein